MNTTSNKAIWIGLLLGVLIATSPKWLSADHPTSHYDAPWIYPGEIQLSH